MLEVVLAVPAQSTPHELKVRVVEEGFRNAGLKLPAGDVFEVVDAIGDPLHISIAGFVVGALSNNSLSIPLNGFPLAPQSSYQWKPSP